MPDEISPLEDVPRIPGALPLIPLRDAVPFPLMVMPLVVGRKKSIQVVDDVLVKDKMVVLVTQKDAEVEDPKPEDLYGVGVAAVILKMFRFPDGTTRILVQGMERVRTGKALHTDPYIVVEVFVESDKGDPQLPDVKALAGTVRNDFIKLLSFFPHIPEEIRVMAMNIEEPGRLADFIASNLNVAAADKQKTLEILDIQERLTHISKLLSHELQVADLGNRIQKEVQEKMSKGQREYLLREQLKAIQKELGEEEGKDVAVEELRKKLTAASLSEEAQKEAERELERIARMNPASPEYSVSITYLEWLSDLPWQKLTEDVPDVATARRILDRDHYDLQKPKERILEYIAVRKVSPENRGPILCFAGPPGVGKTSLGKSIANALGKNFFRISLGGIRDEAEIRGHRRTYVGALPGKIIQGVVRSGSRNPVFMLDEVDKIGMDFRGDPTSALLEVLDPEQNNSFVDHYLGVSFDLSQVLFIVTANRLDTIPPALRDRLEIIALPGYSDEEKIHIARRHIIPQQLKAHGLKKTHVKLSNKAVLALIRGYTRESGVRNLDREIASLCRKVAVRHAEGNKRPVTIDPGDLHDFLGPARIYPNTAERLTISGIATGLAWTPTGGEILFVEATSMPGKGRLILTGHLGNVMKESAQTGLSIVRNRAENWGIDPGVFAERDIHIHVPEGAIPKDGPSAGVVMVTALVSLFTGRRVKSDVAATGEITLRGKVMPVGGIKEKVLAAVRAGIKQVILPTHNKPDLEEIPREYLKNLKVSYAETIDDVIGQILQKNRAPRLTSRSTARSKPVKRR
ncbi:MAG: endopeptidase La [Planctomycetes bacterium]|nr:endopeptidase La [Planctomycetota bacterium]